MSEVNRGHFDCLPAGPETDGPSKGTITRSGAIRGFWRSYRGCRRTAPLLPPLPTSSGRLDGGDALAVREARRRTEPTAPLHLVGFSNGGALALCMRSIPSVMKNCLGRIGLY